PQPPLRRACAAGAARLVAYAYAGPMDGLVNEARTAERVELSLGLKADSWQLSADCQTNRTGRDSAGS
ncbi:MAG: hypothetical protein MUF54_12205, partial [Polyangiaceae bacterium]|nr:hypothetical protein [Polyangiaceae bacterium]